MICFGVHYWTGKNGNQRQYDAVIAVFRCAN